MAFKNFKSREGPANRICLLNFIRNFRAKHCFLSYPLRVLLHGLIEKHTRIIENFLTILIRFKMILLRFLLILAGVQSDLRLQSLWHSKISRAEKAPQTGFAY